MKLTLGQYLASIRKDRRMTLREVEEATDKQVSTLTSAKSKRTKSKNRHQIFCTRWPRSTRSTSRTSWRWPDIFYRQQAAPTPSAMAALRLLPSITLRLKKRRRCFNFFNSYAAGKTLVTKPDDSSLEPEDLRVIEKRAGHLLDHADAWDRFPVPVNDILGAANVRLAPTSIFDPVAILEYLKGRATDAGRFIKSAIAKVLGIYDAEEHLIHIDETVGKSRANLSRAS